MSANNGCVSYYTKSAVTVPVYFPENDISCRWCKLFCRYEENFKRYSCRLTDEWLINPFSGVGNNCPLIFEDGDNNGISTP